MGLFDRLFGRRRSPAPPRPRPLINLDDARARHVPGGVPSPCISVCQMDEQTGLCRGCYRTLDEIADWARLTDRERLEAWARIEARQMPAARS